MTFHELIIYMLAEL